MLNKIFNLLTRTNKETDASRIYKIYKSVDTKERIDNIVHSEYRKMIFLAEKAALNGEISLVFDIEIEEKDEIYFNIILSAFITKIVENGFRYSRQMLSNKKRITIYFSVIDKK